MGFQKSPIRTEAIQPAQPSSICRRRRQTRPSCNLARVFKKKKRRRNECRRRRQNGTEPCDAMRCGARVRVVVGGNLQPKPTPAVPLFRLYIRIFSATAAARIPPNANPTHAGRGQAPMLIRSCRACWHGKQKRTCRTHLHEHASAVPSHRPRSRRQLGLWGKKKVRRPRRPAPSRRGRIVSSGASAKLSHEVPQRQQHLNT